MSYINHAFYEERNYKTIDELTFMSGGAIFYFGVYQKISKGIHIAYFKRANCNDTEVAMVYGDVITRNIFDWLFRVPLLDKAIEIGRIVKERIIAVESHRVNNETQTMGKVYDLHDKRVHPEK